MNQLNFNWLVIFYSIGKIIMIKDPSNNNGREQFVGVIVAIIDRAALFGN